MLQREPRSRPFLYRRLYCVESVHHSTQNYDIQREIDEPEPDFAATREIQTKEGCLKFEGPAVRGPR